MKKGPKDMTSNEHIAGPGNRSVKSFVESESHGTRKAIRKLLDEGGRTRRISELVHTRGSRPSNEPADPEDENCLAPFDLKNEVKQWLDHISEGG